jgi:excisionase family DNA binding protein
MSLQQTQASQRKRRNSPATLHPDHVLSIPEWCNLNGFSIRTGRRIRADGDGPVETRLSAKRIGITVADNARWQKSRACAPPAEVSPTPPLAVPMREACRLLSIRRGHAYRLLRNGELQSYTDGLRRRSITMASIHQYIERQLATGGINSAAEGDRAAPPECRADQYELNLE